jgi:APA family basic amino acid/polyamine antiporter
LGLGFGLCFSFGNMIGVGILRLPGMVAGAAGTPTLIILCWCVGGLYALMGAVSLSELAAMYPEAGGFRVYARRAFGERAGFVVGWIDWLACAATLSYASVAAVEFAGTLWPAVLGFERSAAIGVLALLAAVHSVGVRAGSSITAACSVAIGISLLLVVAGCLFAAPVAHPVAAATLAAPAVAAGSTLLMLAPAVRAIVTAYDGWYAPIYTAEETTDAGRLLPRAMIGGALVTTALYLLINVALLRVLSVPQLAGSNLPVAAAAEVVLPHGSATPLTLLSILIVLGLINANSLMAPRVLFSMAREGWIPPVTMLLSRGGTPWVALVATMVVAGAMILSGTFNRLISLFAMLILLYYIAAFLAVFALRRRLPQAPRPYRAFGYPFSTSVVLLGSIGFLLTAVLEDWRAAVTALLFLSLCVPAYALAARARRTLAAAPALGAG